MLEMMAVLAIMGVLSAVAVLGLRLALNKSKANTIVHDSRIVFVESMTRQGEVITGWEEYQHPLESNKPFWMMRDVSGNNYVKVGEVAQEVCAQMLPLQKEGEMVFKDPDTYEPFTECLDVEGGNTIMMAFDGLGIPKDCEITKHCEDGGKENAYCDSNGRCVECDPAISTVNEAGDGCACNESVALTCTDENNNSWCCAAKDENGNDQICGEMAGACGESDGSCQYEVTIPTTRTQTTNCSYFVSVPSTRTQVTNCSYNVSIVKMAQYIEDGPYVQVAGDSCPENALNCKDEVVVEAENDPCPTGQYCYLAYTTSDCRLEAEDTSTGILYGTCILETAADKSCAYTAASNVTVTEKAGHGCPMNQYCYLKWTEQTCTDEATDSAEGTLWGKCMDYASADPSSCR